MYLNLRIFHPSLIQVWNLKNMDNRPVVRINRREKPVSIHFPLMWHALICSFDDALKYKRIFSCILILIVRYFNSYNNPIHGSVILYYLNDLKGEKPIKLLPMNSTTWVFNKTGEFSNFN